MTDRFACRQHANHVDNAQCNCRPSIEQDRLLADEHLEEVPLIHEPQASWHAFTCTYAQYVPLCICAFLMKVGNFQFKWHSLRAHRTGGTRKHEWSYVRTYVRTYWQHIDIREQASKQVSKQTSRLGLSTLQYRNSRGRLQRRTKDLHLFVVPLAVAVVTRSNYPSISEPPL